MKVSCGQLVVRNDGKVGYVACFNDMPILIAFQDFCKNVQFYDDVLKLKYSKSDKYDIARIYDASSVEEPTQYYKKSMRSELEALPLVWERSSEEN